MANLPGLVADARRVSGPYLKGFNLPRWVDGSEPGERLTASSTILSYLLSSDPRRLDKSLCTATRLMILWISALLHCLHLISSATVLLRQRIGVTLPQDSHSNS